MALSAAQIVTLEAELKNDPSALGYAPFIAAGDYLNLVTCLNFVRDGVTPFPNNGIVGAAITGVRNQLVSTQQIIGAIDPADLITNGTATTITADQQGKLMLFQSLCNDGSIALTNPDGSDNNNAKTLKKVVGSTSASHTAIVALETRNGSRAEQLFSLSGNPAGVVVTNADVEAALASGNA